MNIAHLYSALDADQLTSQVCCVNSLELFGDLQSYTCLKTAEYKEPENQCLHLFTFLPMSLQQPSWIFKTTAFQYVIAPFASCKPPYIYIQSALVHNIKV